mmetsp:Transcript_63732/g.99305  ORF Transcript_63732/g.99305 Transcript_63732/m.99305 type:complete len:186 (-) Transcript_63732:18-575(-)
MPSAVVMDLENTPPRRFDGAAFRKAFNIPESSVDRLRTGRSLSESRLSSVAGSRRSSSRASVARSVRSAVKSEVSRVLGEDAMWKELAPLGQRDHVSMLMSHPLPTRGMNNVHDFHERSSVGPNPVVPIHIARPMSLNTDTFAYGKEMANATLDQRLNLQWHGMQRNHNSEHNEQMVTMGHIVRK